jgi:hypothetical protein
MSPLFYTLTRLSQLQSERVDHLALTEILEPYANLEVTQQSAADIKKILRKICYAMQLPAPKFMRAADAAKTPLLAFHEGLGWGIVRGLNAKMNGLPNGSMRKPVNLKRKLFPNWGC